MSTRALIGCVLFAAAISLFFWQSPFVYPFRLLVTLMHESGHAFAAILMGGSVQSVTISPSEGGLTLSALPDVLPRRLFVVSAGYVGSSLAGAALLALAGRVRSGRLVLWGLAVWVAAVALLWVPYSPPHWAGDVALRSGYAPSDGRFTLAFAAGTALALGLVAQWAPLWLRRVAIVWIATLSCLTALEDLKSLFGYGLLSGSASDADAMQRLTHVPAVVWASLWLLMSAGAMWLGLRSILKRRMPAPRTGARTRGLSAAGTASLP